MTSWCASMPPTRKRSNGCIRNPAALKIFSEFTNLPERVVSKVRDFCEGDLAPDRIVGVDQIIAEAVGMKYLAAPPSLNG